MSNIQPRPFSIRIFLPDGIPDGVKIVEKSNWSGICIVCPRSLFSEAKKRPEFNYAGVYVLVGPSDEIDLPMIYVGEGDPIKPRLDTHYANKDFWTRFIMFVSKDRTLNKAHVQFLEQKLITLAKESKRSILDNSITPTLPSLTEPEQADVDSFLMDMLSIFPILGISVFDKPGKSIGKEMIFHIKAKGINAKGKETVEGFVVLKGSQMVKSETPSIHSYLKKLRANLNEHGIVTDKGNVWEFIQDYSFNSPSTAAGVIQGRTANGRIDWKDGKGKSLKQYQQEEASKK